MKSKTRNFLRGAGSVMALTPAIDLRKIIPHRSPAERMASHFVRVGDSVGRACGSFESNGKTINKTTKAA